jgi:predicted glycosyltransferase involved in capsule biosynthesis
LLSTHSDKETVTFAWCDGGTVEGRFASGILNTMLESLKHGIKVSSSIRVQGNQIARQRQSLIDYWYNNMDSDWLMWVDSDIVMTMDAFKLLWDSAEKIQ